ncbi:AAA family ATPase [Patescibacteria group bacterium]|nr:AAA family ATPase [Patescibacteria group bacterium]
MEKQLFIGITGRSCSGKSTLAHKLLKRLGENSLYIELDKFWINTSNLDCKNLYTSEVCAIHKMHDDLSKLKSNMSVDLTCFDFKKKSKLDGKKGKTLFPTKYTIVEGCLIFWDKKIRNLFDVKVFVDVPDEICFQRRKSRDLEKLIRKYSEDKIKNHTIQHWSTIKKQWDTGLENTRNYADLITADSSDKSIDRVISKIFEAG